jgi:hypothetical protein
MLKLIIGSVFLLTACAGTNVQYQGPLCGGTVPASLALTDAKDRAGFEARCTHTTYNIDGTVAAVDEVVISSSESSASAVISAQAEAINRLVATLAAGKP